MRYFVVFKSANTWEQRELRSVFTIRNEKNGDRYSREDVLAVSDTYGCVNQIKFHGRSFAGEDISNYKVVRTGDIVYTKSPLQAKPYGIIKIVGEETGIISPLYVVNETIEGIDPMFMYYLFDTPERTNNYLSPLVRKGAKNTMNISNEEWLSGIVTISPNEEEQRAIGNYFKSLDNLITLHQRKCETLQKLKKSMLQKMFPKNGSLYPEIRFAGFTDAWEQRKLKSITSVITKGTTPLDKSNSGTVNFIKVENIDNSSGEISISQKISKEEHEGYLKRSQLQENDILFSIAGTLGRVTSVNSDILPANTNQALAIIRLKECNLDYIKTFLKSKAVTDYIKRNPTVGAQPNLSLEQVGNLEIQVPSLREQQSIGNYFKSLDNLITLHQRKLETLKKMKKSMLQKMFI